MPDDVRGILSYLWGNSVHQGRDISFYHLENVWVAEEGLVFDARADLIDRTRTYHSDEEIARAHVAVTRAAKDGSTPSVERGILAKSRGAENYGHFLIEMLPRAWLARTKLRLADWPVIIHDGPAAVRSTSIQALGQAGVGPDQIIGIGREPVFFARLVVVDGLTSHGHYLSPVAMQCLDAITEAIPRGSSTKIYAPRRPATSRDFQDEPAVAKCLEQRGFIETRTAAMAFGEQVSAFKGAEVVVGVIGAALTNIAFCRPGTEVVVFSSSGAPEVLFWMIAETRRLRYREIRCRQSGPQLGILPWDRALAIGPDEVGRFLERRSSV